MPTLEKSLVRGVRSWEVLLKSFSILSMHQRQEVETSSGVGFWVYKIFVKEWSVSVSTERQMFLENPDPS